MLIEKLKNGLHLCEPFFVDFNVQLVALDQKNKRGIFDIS
jgi:hypothetical protein